MGKGRKAEARVKAKETKAGAKNSDLNFSDASVQLFHPSHEGDQASTTVILTVGEERLAFNCVEGFQRMCSECNTKASRLNAVMMSSITFQTCNGLPGTVISCAEAAKTSRSTLNIIGPRGMGRFMNAMAAYSDYVLQELNLNVKELAFPEDSSSLYTVVKEPVYSTTKLSCYAVLLSAGDKEGASKEDGPPAKRARTDGAQEKDGPTESEDNSENSGNKAVAIYVCRLPTRRGKFNAQKAKELGLRPGPNFGRLAAGEAVTAPSGRVIQPEECMEASVLGECITVIDCPSTAYLPALSTAMPSVKELMEDPDGKKLKAVFHMGPEDVVMHEDYQGALHPLQEAKHFAAEKQFDPCTQAPAIRKAVLLQLQLHLMCPGMIPRPVMLPAEELAAARQALLEPLPPVDPNAPRQRQPQPAPEPSKKQIRKQLALEKFAKQKAAKRKGKGGQKNANSDTDAAEGAPKDASAAESKEDESKEETAHNATEQEPKQEDQHASADLPQVADKDSEQGETQEEPLSISKEPGKAAEPKQIPADGSWLRMQHLEKLILRPLGRKGVCSAEVGKPLDAQAVAAELRNDFRSAVEAAQSPDQHDVEMEDGKVEEEGFQTVFLGTGAACPSKYRNVTSVYLDFYERGGLLLDAGEATLGQLIRRFGVDDAKRRVKELRAVWISHRHADHHVGVSRVLSLRRQLLPADSPPLPVFGPPPLRRVLSACNKLESLHYTWIDQYCICPHEQGVDRDLQYCWDHAARFDAGPVVKQICQDLGLLSFSSVLNVHCKHSFGFRMVSSSGKTFVFSGDTEKCDNVINAAKEADILIHEATFESDMIADAKFKKHSTIEDALSVAAEAQCKAVVLTHFSQRYPKVGKLTDVCGGSAAVAFDMMTIDSKRLQTNSASLIRVLNKFFSDDTEEEPAAAAAQGQSLQAVHA